MSEENEVKQSGPTMELKIIVDQSMFDNIIKDKLEALSPEDFNKVFMEAIREWLTANNYRNLERLMVEKGQYYDSQDKPSRFFQELLHETDKSELQKIVDLMIDGMKEKYSEILIAAVSDFVGTGIAYSSLLHERIRSICEDQRAQLVSDIRNGKI